MILKYLHIFYLLVITTFLLAQSTTPSIKGELPLWQRYMENSRNIKNGAAFIPLAMRMVIEQLSVTDHDDLYNLDIQIHLALKDMAFFRGLKEDTREFKDVVNQTARKGDHIEMTIHPERKTIDLHVYGEIITFDVFDIKLKTLKWKDLAGSMSSDKEFKIMAVIGEESLIIEKNFGIRELLAEPDEIEYESVAISAEKSNIKTLKPVFYYRENNYDFTSSFYQADNHFEADLFGTHTFVDNEEKSVYYRYLIGLVDQAFIPQLEFGGAWKYSSMILSGSLNGGYNIKNNSLLFGLTGTIFKGDAALIFENSFFNIGEEVYDKNDLNLTPRLELSGLYNVGSLFSLSAGAVYQQNKMGMSGNFSSREFYNLKFIADTEYFPEGDQFEWKVGLSYNYHSGKPEQTPLNSFRRTNRKAFSAL